MLISHVWERIFENMRHTFWLDGNKIFLKPEVEAFESNIQSEQQKPYPQVRKRKKKFKDI